MTIRSALMVSVLSITLIGPVLADTTPSPSPTPSPTSPRRNDDFHQSYPSQSTVAIKGSFKTVSASSTAVTGALTPKDTDKALALVGKTASVVGTVTKVFSPHTNSYIALDFDEDYSHTIIAFIRPDYYSKLPDLQTLSKKELLVTGQVTKFHEQTEITVTKSDQIEIVSK